MCEMIQVGRPSPFINGWVYTDVTGITVQHVIGLVENGNDLNQYLLQTVYDLLMAGV